MNIFCFGEGWLGKLIKEKAQQEGAHFYGTTTKGEGNTVTWKIGDDIPNLANVTHVMIAIPASKWEKEQLEWFLSQLQTMFNGHVTWISSIGVYPNKGRYSEFSKLDKAEMNAKNQTLWEQEQLVLRYFENACVVRMGGLFGYKRHPANYFIQQREIPNGQGVAHMIHGDDAAGLTFCCAKQEVKGIVNGVTPDLPSRQAYYEAAFSALHLGTPNIKDGREGKVIISERIGVEISYIWKYTNPVLAYELENGSKGR